MSQFSRDLNILREQYAGLSEARTGPAIPVFDGHERQVGALCLYTTTKMGGDYTLGLVKLMAHGIENRLLFRTYHGEAHILRFNTSASSLDTNWAGLLVIDYGGVIRAANRRARTMLGEQLMNVHIRQVFDLEPEELTSIASRKPVGLQANGNYRLFAQLSSRQEDYSAGDRAIPDYRVPDDLIPNDVVAPGDLEHGDSRVRRLVRQARKIMEKDIPILIYGETGSARQTAAHCFWTKLARCP